MNIPATMRYNTINMPSTLSVIEVRAGIQSKMFSNNASKKKITSIIKNVIISTSNTREV